MEKLIFWIKSFFRIFSRETFREASGDFHRSAEKIPFRCSDLTTSRVQNRIDWCREFNKRNGYIVSEKSPISVYFATRGKHGK